MHSYVYSTEKVPVDAWRVQHICHTPGEQSNRYALGIVMTTEQADYAHSLQSSLCY